MRFNFPIPTFQPEEAMFVDTCSITTAWSENLLYFRSREILLWNINTIQLYNIVCSHYQQSYSNLSLWLRSIYNLGKSLKICSKLMMTQREHWKIIQSATTKPYRVNIGQPFIQVASLNIAMRWSLVEAMEKVLGKKLSQRACERHPVEVATDGRYLIEPVWYRHYTNPASTCARLPGFVRRQASEPSRRPATVLSAAVQPWQWLEYHVEEGFGVAAPPTALGKCGIVRLGHGVRHLQVHQLLAALLQALFVHEKTAAQRTRAGSTTLYYKQPIRTVLQQLTEGGRYLLNLGHSQQALMEKLHCCFLRDTELIHDLSPTI